MKIYFIHGFGENEAIFDRIAPAIAGNQVFINVWNLLGTQPREGLNILNFAQEVIAKYNITADDVVIGHSMGGWIAYHIKHFAQCRIIQIASWTDGDKILSPIKDPKMLYWLTRNGLYVNNFVLWLFGLTYKGLPSAPYFKEAFERLIAADREAVVNQMKLMAEPVEKISVLPDLRIHALKDKVIRYPSEPFHEVPGDHFTLVTHPETVIEPIVKFLEV